MTEFKRRTLKFTTGKQMTLYGNSISIGKTLEVGEGDFQVMPVGRLINVKILKAVNSDVYKELEEGFESHYKNDKRVNDIYISNSGTIMIDCRN